MLPVIAMRAFASPSINGSSTRLTEKPVPGWSGVSTVVKNWFLTDAQTTDSCFSMIGLGEPSAMPIIARKPPPWSWLRPMKVTLSPL